LPINSSIETSNTKKSTNQFKLFVVDLILNDQDFKDEILNLTKEVVKEEISNFKNEMKDIFQPSIHFEPKYEETLELDPKIQEIIGKEFPGCPLHHCTISDLGIIDGSPKIISFGLVKEENCHNIFQFLNTVTEQDIARIFRIGKLYKLQNPEMKLSCFIFSDNVPEDVINVANSHKIKILNI